VQFVPNLFPVLRALIDQNRQPGRFLLLGSASPALLQQSSESLAGRVRYREMFPLTLGEVEADHVNQLWFRGGFPNAYLAGNDTEAMHWQADFVRSYTSRDMALLGLPMPPTQIERLLQMLAHNHGQLLNASNLARSLGVSAPTVTNALYYLEEAMLIRILKPWHANTTKRLVKSPKVYIRDTGMLHHLLATGSLNQLFGHPQAGNSWEGFVIQQLLATLPPGLQPYFYRTAAGAELDLLLVGSNKVEWAIEIKMSGTPQLTRGNTEAQLDLQPAQSAIITPMSGSYPFRDKWMVYGVGDILEEVIHNQ
jgi:predicted AAA+ superfamily ATPase